MANQQPDNTASFFFADTTPVNGSSSKFTKMQKDASNPIIANTPAPAKENEDENFFISSKRSKYM